LIAKTLAGTIPPMIIGNWTNFIELRALERRINRTEYHGFGFVGDRGMPKSVLYGFFRGRWRNKWPILMGDG
jgi:hypothetical protein